MYFGDKTLDSSVAEPDPQGPRILAESGSVIWN
jgi:hypothetical protein